jgi:hypothetical protein
VSTQQLGFSLGEPAVIVYRTDGEFKPHQDRQSLTVLIPLSGPRAFDGGGTAFWTAADCSGDNPGHNAPFISLIPQAGTAILFGGSVVHAGQTITAGERCVLVASFSPVDEPLPADDPLERALSSTMPAVIVAGWRLPDNAPCRRATAAGNPKTVEEPVEP